MFEEEKIFFYKDQVNLYLEKIFSALTDDKPQRLYMPMRYAMEGNGKRLRPVLLLLTCEALAGPLEAALPAAAAVELMHNFTLVHDDIMDNDDTRRGRPTVHRQWNKEVALLAGDGLLALAYRCLLHTRSSSLQRISQVFTDGILEICEGQALDCDFEQRGDVTMADYLGMIMKKTARLLSICTEIGALIAEAGETQIRLLRQFGEHLGLAFQIQDDLLDITSSQEILGKDFGSDIKRRKRTFLYVHVTRRGRREHREALKKIFSKPTIAPPDILSAQQIFQAAGALAAAETAAAAHLKKALACLTQLEPAATTEGLREFTDMLLKRKA
ncbi:MAG: polyprenyl synthetase family protein [candidate division KSB1 bacterium]|nr:polyprenyl synthetase family protein [candidate division KSB1 bacterium]MDZ7366134.1 polyprenyl synthetase family protein [candidate division KSB1 bacterium]MDZ7404224.1 polyprenyl synthetase family protein [candidate division KSB1 bacterium]